MTNTALDYGKVTLQDIYTKLQTHPYLNAEALKTMGWLSDTYEYIFAVDIESGKYWDSDKIINYLSDLHERLNMIKVMTEFSNSQINKIKFPFNLIGYNLSNGNSSLLLEIEYRPFKVDLENLDLYVVPKSKRFYIGTTMDTLSTYNNMTPYIPVSITEKYTLNKNSPLLEYFGTYASGLNVNYRLPFTHNETSNKTVPEVLSRKYKTVNPLVLSQKLELRQAYMLFKLQTKLSRKVWTHLRHELLNSDWIPNNTPNFMRNKELIITWYINYWKIMHPAEALKADEQVIFDTINLAQTLHHKWDIPQTYKSILKLHDKYVDEDVMKKVERDKSSKKIIKHPPEYTEIVKTIKANKNWYLCNSEFLLVKEGIMQHNCVSTYQSSVKSGSCIIVHGELPNKLGVTIQINRKLKIIQVMKKYNEPLTPDEMQYIKSQI